MERCPLTIRLGVRGSVVRSPSGVRGGAPAEMDFMHILGQKEATWNTIFSIFERRRGPPNVAGPGKTPPFPLSTGLIFEHVKCICVPRFQFSKYATGYSHNHTAAIKIPVIRRAFVPRILCIHWNETRDGLAT